MDITSYLTECVNKKIPVSFSKYGDGEYCCVKGSPYCNADMDFYTEKLQIALKKSFTYMVDECNNSFIGLWHDKDLMNFWENLVNSPVHWAQYHSIIIDIDDMKNQNDSLKHKISLYKSIKESKLKKIIICNPLLIRAKGLLNIDHMVNVHLCGWFDTLFDKVIGEVQDIISENNDEQFILITACGMSAKVIISELSKKYPNGIYLDFGSALDFICTKRDSRGRGYNYEDIVDTLKDILPENWEDDKYNEVYELAKSHLGVHLPK